LEYEDFVEGLGWWEQILNIEPAAED